LCSKRWHVYLLAEPVYGFAVPEPAEPLHGFAVPEPAEPLHGFAVPEPAEPLHGFAIPEPAFCLLNFEQIQSSWQTRSLDLRCDYKVE